MRIARKDSPLLCQVIGGQLVISIGVDTLAFSALRSPVAWDMMDDAGKTKPEERFSVPNPPEFAWEIVQELTAEAEDGSSMLTKLFDDAVREAIEQGAQHWVDKEDK